MDPHDNLIHHCQNWRCYPLNLLRPNQLKRSLNNYRERLELNDKRLFNPNLEAISFFELDDGDRLHKEEVIKNSDALQQHLRQNRKDPRCRFIFLEAVDSRSALKCSRQSFLYTLSFHQIPSSFLEFLFSFGSTAEPLDYHMTGFQGDHTLASAGDRLLEIPRLGRSGCEHRMQYLLRSVEHSGGDPTTVPWKIRQMAVFHSFDFLSAKALWINIKANKLMRERIKEGVVEFPELSSTASDSLPGCFAATLLTHLIHLEWCDENWRQCINDIEHKIRGILNKAKTSRIDQQPKFSSSLAFKTAITMQSSKTQTMDAHRVPSVKQATGSLLEKLGAKHHSMNGKNDSQFGPTLPQTVDKSAAQHASDFEKQLESLMALDTFSFKEMQLLHYLHEQLESFRLVMELNQQTLRDIAEHYRDLAEHDQFPEEVKAGCKQELTEFLRRIERIKKNLEIRLTQVTSLIAWLQDGKSLFDGILQYRSVQVGRIFTESSQVQQSKMEQIAYKTEKETISMHIITFVTLSFLPATFLAAFFQSGLVDINKEATGLKDAVEFHLSAFQLFAAICFPLMILVISVWIFLFIWLSRRARPLDRDSAV